MDNNLNTQSPRNSFLGINTDNYNSKSPTFILNGVIESSEENSQGIITTEDANTLCFTLPTGHKVIGNIPMENNEMVIFTTDNTTSKIFIVKDCVATQIVSAVLGFRDVSMIQGTFKIHKGCERVIYWNDNHLNPDRYFNFDDVDAFKTAGVFDANKFRLTPDKKFINIKVDSINNTGGSLELGQYFFQVDVLDSNQKVVYSSLLSNSVVIYDDSQNLAYNQIDGGLNYPAFTAEVGGVIKTTKSINLSFTNVDTAYSYLQLKVLKYTSADKITASSHSVATLIPITGTSVNFTYTGFNVSNGDINLDNSELTITSTAPDSSSYMEQVQGRLLRANIREKLVDYSTFQSFANQINVGWTIKESEYNNALDAGNNKNPLTYQDFTGYMSDEVYAFGVVYVLADGSTTPVFHIPGRPSVSNDTLGLVVGVDVGVDYVKHVNPNAVNGDVIPKWKLVNTAATGVLFNPMSYYEDEQQVYPDTRDCLGNPVWGSLVGQKIRHHKFPDRQFVPLVNSATKKIQNLGAYFSNITLPTGVTGYFFVKAERDELNKTVLDNGYISSHKPENNNINEKISINNFFSDIDTTTNFVNMFISPKTYLSKEFLAANYVRKLFTLAIPANNKGYSLTETPTTPNDDGVPYNYAKAKRYYYGKNYFDPTSGKITVVSPLPNSFLITSSGYIKENSISNQFGAPVENQSYTGSIFAVKTNVIVHTTLNEFERCYGSLKTYKSVYSNIFSLKYERIGNLNQTTCFNGDVFVSSMNVLFGQYLKLSVPEDTEMSRLSNGWQSIDLLFESEINSGLRHGGTGECNEYYKNINYSDMTLESQNAGAISINITAGDASAYFRNKYMTKALPTDFLKPVFCTEYNGYNLDYNKITNPQKFFPVESSFDYCSSCSNEFKQRIIYSEKSFTEEKQDSYLVYKTNNYVDIPANRGKITGLKYKENNLLVHTEEATFVIRPNPQILVTNQTDVVLGTGDFLSLPPQELITTDTGHGGCQNRYGKCTTPFGYFWVDERNSAVYKYDDKFENIARIGLYNYFKENLKSNLSFYPERLKDNPYYTDFIQLYYDERHKRILLTKIDYSVNISTDPMQVGAPVTSVVWSGGNEEHPELSNQFVDQLGRPVILTNKYVFENKSFTLSFSPETNSWISWHSYIPKFSYFNNVAFYTSNDGLSFYKHFNTYHYRTFYEELKPFIVEYAEQSYETKELINLEYISQAKIFDNTSKEWIERKDITFSKLWLYTKDQSTGELDLVLGASHLNPFSNLGFNATIKNVIQSDKNYKVSNLYKNRIVSPTTKKAWLSLAPFYFIDKVPNTNQTFEQINLSGIKDKNIFVRLKFDSDLSGFEMVKLSLYLSNINQQLSIR